MWKQSQNEQNIFMTCKFSTANRFIWDDTKNTKHISRNLSFKHVEFVKCVFWYYNSKQNICYWLTECFSFGLSVNNNMMNTQKTLIYFTTTTFMHNTIFASGSEISPVHTTVITEHYGYVLFKRRLNKVLSVLSASFLTLSIA